VISRREELEILRLFRAENWNVGTIARQRGHHHEVVERVLEQSEAGTNFSKRASLVDPYVPFITEIFEKYPDLPASRLFQMVKERGYTGKPDHFRALMPQFRPMRAVEAFLRLRTLAGEQAQIDWGHFGKMPVEGGERTLFVFVMVLSYSRKVFARFYLSAAMSSFLDGHVQAFNYFQGVPRVGLYDNLKSAVLERDGPTVRFNPTFLELAAHYRFEPRPVAVARGNEKGRVERTIRYLRTSFFPARTFKDIDDINDQLRDWQEQIANKRPCPEDRKRTVDEAFLDETGLLLKLPDNPFPGEEHKAVHAGKTPYVRFDRNDYSIPHTHVRRTLLVCASTKRVRVLDGTELIAEHERSWARGKQIEDRRHIEALVQTKHKATQHRGMDLLHHAVPSTRAFLTGLAERGGNLGAATTGLLKLLGTFGAELIEQVIRQAVDNNTPHLGAIRHILDSLIQERGLPPPVTVCFSDTVQLAQAPIRTHSLSSYDQLRKETDDDTN
jgi:transposase